MTAHAKDGFWAWSLDRYQREGVSALCLRMQDEFALNVNILLWLCWCAAKYPEVPELIQRKAIDVTGQWNREIIAPLRSARRYLKSAQNLTTETPAGALRAAILKIELEAEKIEQTTLQSLAEETLEEIESESAKQCNIRPNNPRQCARRNLAVYMSLAGAVKQKGFSISLFESLIELIFPAAEPVSGD